MRGISKRKEETMAIGLIFYGHDTLKKIAEEVTNIDGDLVRLIDSMFNVMYREKGVGLAAPQVDVSKRVIVIDPDERGGSGPMEMINPVIKEFSDREEPYQEGCLSVPGIMEDVVRPTGILISGKDRNGKDLEFEADGFLARVLQHEVDHLNGILFIDRIEDYVRKELRPELKKVKKLNKRLL